MSKKGFVLIFPLIAIALLVTSTAVGISLKSEKSQKEAVGKVLSDRDKEDTEDVKSEDSGKIDNDRKDVDADNASDEFSANTGSSEGQRMEFEKDSGLVDRILKEGTEKAREEAQKTLTEVRRAMQLDYFS